MAIDFKVEVTTSSIDSTSKMMKKMNVAISRALLKGVRSAELFAKRTTAFKNDTGDLKGNRITSSPRTIGKKDEIEAWVGIIRNTYRNQVNVRKRPLESSKKKRTWVSEFYDRKESWTTRAPLYGLVLEGRHSFMKKAVDRVDFEQLIAQELRKVFK